MDWPLALEEPMNYQWKINVWKWWCEHRDHLAKERELQQRWISAFGCVLARPGEKGHAVCLQAVQRVALQHRERFLESKRRLLGLQQRLPPPMDPVLVWADVNAARLQLEQLIAKWCDLILLIREAKIIELEEDMVLPAMEELEP